MTEIRIDEPLENGNCQTCTHSMQVKRALKCDVIRENKYISCREVRVCGNYNQRSS